MVVPTATLHHVSISASSTQVVSEVLSKMIMVGITDPGEVCCLRPGGVDSAYERGGDAPRKFWIKPLKETDLGVAQAFFDP